MSALSAAFGLSPLPPSTLPARIVVLLRRAQALGLAELEAVDAIRASWQDRSLEKLDQLEILALEGLQGARLRVSARVLGPDPELRSLPALVDLLEQLRAAVPDARLEAWDPLCLLSLDGQALSCSGGGGLPDCGPEWQHPQGPPGAGPGTRLAGSAAPPSPPVRQAPPATDAELVDLLRLMDAGLVADRDEARDLLRSAARRHGEAAWRLLFSGILPGACCQLLALDLQRPGLDRPALVEAARALLSDGDGREREAAGELLRILEVPPPPADADAEELATWDQVAPLGRRLLRWPGLAALREETTGSGVGDQADDLDLGAEQDLLPGAALDAAVAGLAQEPALLRLAALAESPAFARRALGRLGADDDSTTGTCLALLVGLWPLGRLPGWLPALAALTRDPSRPWPTRALALRVLGRGGGPDALALLAEASAWPETELGAAALRGLASHPDPRALRRLRQAAREVDRAAVALDALAERGDAGALGIALDLLQRADVPTRHAAASALPRLGGSRAIDGLRAALQDPARPVQIAANAALAGLEPRALAAPRLAVPDEEVAVAAMRTAGQARRVDLLPELFAASSAPAPARREAAAEALGRMGLSLATPRLMEMVLDPDIPVALAALDALETAGDARALRLLRLLAGHPGLPGQRAGRVLRRGRQLRRPPPDTLLALRARTERSIDSQTRARLAAALKQLPLQVRVHERGLAGEGQVDPEDIGLLLELAQVLDRVDALLPGLAWSVRDPQALLGRGPRGWVLSASAGRPLVQLQRSAGFWAEEPARLPRPPLQPELLQRPAVAPVDEATGVGSPASGAAGLAALTVGRGGTGAPPPAQDGDPYGALLDDEDVGDERTEQTISAFLEEVTGGPPQAPDFEELLFEPDPGEETAAG